MRAAKSTAKTIVNPAAKTAAKPAAKTAVKTAAGRAAVRAAAPREVAAFAPRLTRIDALRGAAMAWMTAYHFAFDLNHFGWWRQDFLQDPFWTIQRTAIVSLFLLCAGMGQAVAARRCQGWPRFWRRWARVAACAALVSLGSWWMFPRSWISFGVLHGLCAMLPLLRLAATRGWLSGAAPWLAGAALVAAAPVAAAWLPGAPPDLVAALQSRWLNGLGLVAVKPLTEDYVPLLPWLGVALWGAAAGDWLLARRPRWLAADGRAPMWPMRAAAALGRHSLPYYMLHQPVLIGLLMAARAWGA